MKKFNLYRVNPNGSLEQCGTNRSGLSCKEALMFMLSGGCYSFTATRSYFKDSVTGKRWMIWRREVDYALFIAVEVAK